MGDYPAFNKLVAELSASPAVQQDKRLRMLLHFVETAWVDREPQRALPALESGLTLARELHDTKYEGRLTGALGIYYYYAGGASKATLILDALKMAIKSGDKVYVLRWGMVVTIGLASMGHQERALDLMKLGLLFGRTIGDVRDQEGVARSDEAVRIYQFFRDLVEVSARSFDGGPAGLPMPEVAISRGRADDFVEVLEQEQKLRQFVQGLVIMAEWGMVAILHQDSVAETVNRRHSEI